MIYKLNEEHIKLLQMLPETGMGSQNINIYFSDGSILKNITVFNCSEFESEKKINLSLIKKIELNKDI